MSSKSDACPICRAKEAIVSEHGPGKCVSFAEFRDRILGAARWALAEENERLRALLLRSYKAHLEFPGSDAAVLEDLHKEFER